MNHLKKFTCAMLCAVYALGITGLTGCQSANMDDTKPQILESISKVADCVKDRDYSSLSAYLYEDNDNLREKFDLGEGKDDEKTVAVRKAIASTIRHNIKTETLTYSFFNKVGTVSVDFMLVDYEKFAENNIYYGSVESMEKSLKDFDRKFIMVCTVPLRFVFNDDKAVLENSEILEQVYSFYDFDKIVFGDNLLEHLSDPTFVDSKDGVYTDPDSITLELKLDEKGQKFDWKYDYEVAHTGKDGAEEVLYTASEEVGAGSETIRIRYSSSKEMEKGSYRISVFFGDKQSDYECKVEHSPKDPQPGEYFRCPEGDSLQLANSDISVKVYGKYFFVADNSSLGEDILATYGKSMLEFIVSDDDGDESNEYLFSLYSSNYGNESVKEVIDYFAKTRKESYEGIGDKVKTKKGKVKIGKKEYQYCDATITRGKHSVINRLIVVPVKNGFHLVMVIARSEDSVKTYTSMLK
ncbi:MAG: hypothetical protein K5643_05180 [Saccharofermentans sp.]|nr:hypothetical protein [Saccharofermentans sp.]